MTGGRIVCVHCGGVSTARRHDRPWCQQCGCYLTLDPAVGEWVSFAEKLWRENEARNVQWFDQTRTNLRRQLDDIRSVVPDGWTTHVNDPGRGLACIDIAPPADRIDVSARLYPPHDGQPGGWYVRINNRTRHVDFPLYIAGGAHAAFFTTAAIATHGAIQTVRGELLASY